MTAGLAALIGLAGSELASEYELIRLCRLSRWLRMAKDRPSLEEVTFLLEQLPESEREDILEFIARRAESRQGMRRLKRR